MVVLKLKSSAQEYIKLRQEAMNYIQKKNPVKVSSSLFPVGLISRSRYNAE